MLIRLVALALVAALALPQMTSAQTQITSSELEQAIIAAASTRERNAGQVRSFFASEPVRSALKTARIDHSRVEKAVSALSVDELSSLASRTNAIQTDFAAGALTNQQLTYVIIALATAVLILVVVAA